MAKKSRLPGIDPAALQEEVPSLSSTPAASPLEPPAPVAERRDVVAVAPTSSALVPPPLPPPAPTSDDWHENIFLRLGLAACLAFMLGYLAGKPYETIQLVVPPPAAAPRSPPTVVPDPAVVQALAAERDARAGLNALLADLSALLAAAAEGRDFSLPLNRLRAAAGSDVATLAVLDGLQPFAAGVPTLTTLFAEFERETAPLLAQSTPVVAQGLPGRTLAWARGLLEPDRLAARSIGLVAMRADLVRGLPEAAAGRLAGLDPSAALALQDWALAAYARAGLDRVVRETALVAVGAAARMAR